MECRIIGCDGSYPGKNGTTSGFLVTEGDEALQLDMGCGVLPRLMALRDPGALNAIILTHWHNDHVSDMLPLQYYLLLNRKRLKVLAPPEEHPLRRLLTGDEFDFLDITAENQAGGFSISAMKVAHPTPAYAVKITGRGKTLVYTGDTAGGEGLPEFCRDADLLICDATFTKAQFKPGLPHFTAAQAGALAREAGVKRLVLTHFPPEGEHAILLWEAQEQFPQAVAAEPGLAISL
jgi:ribonuclease BN (tRNA processing enzyme)